MFPDWRLQDRNPGTFVSYPLHLQTISGLRTVAVTKDAIAPGMIVAVIVRETCRDSTLASSILEASSNGKVVSGGYIEDHRAPSERNFGPLQKVAICVKERPHLILVVNASGFLAAPIYTNNGCGLKDKPDDVKYEHISIFDSRDKDLQGPSAAETLRQSVHEPLRTDSMSPYAPWLPKESIVNMGKTNSFKYGEEVFPMGIVDTTHLERALRLRSELEHVAAQTLDAKAMMAHLYSESGPARSRTDEMNYGSGPVVSAPISTPLLVEPAIPSAIPAAPTSTSAVATPTLSALAPQRPVVSDPRAPPRLPEGDTGLTGSIGGFGVVAGPDTNRSKQSSVQNDQIASAQRDSRSSSAQNLTPANAPLLEDGEIANDAASGTSPSPMSRPVGAPRPLSLDRTMYQSSIPNTRPFSQPDRRGQVKTTADPAMDFRRMPATGIARTPNRGTNKRDARGTPNTASRTTQPAVSFSQNVPTRVGSIEPSYSRERMPYASSGSNFQANAQGTSRSRQSYPGASSSGDDRDEPFDLFPGHTTQVQQPPGNYRRGESTGNRSQRPQSQTSSARNGNTMGNIRYTNSSSKRNRQTAFGIAEKENQPRRRPAAGH